MCRPVSSWSIRSKRLSFSFSLSFIIAMESVWLTESKRISSIRRRGRGGVGQRRSSCCRCSLAWLVYTYNSTDLTRLCGRRLFACFPFRSSRTERWNIGRSCSVNTAGRKVSFSLKDNFSSSRKEKRTMDKWKLGHIEYSSRQNDKKSNIRSSGDFFLLHNYLTPIPWWLDSPIPTG